MRFDLILTALCLWAAAAIADLAVGSRHRLVRQAAYLAGLAGGVCITIAGVRGVVGPVATLDLGSLLGFSHTLVRLDGVAGLFLTLSGALAVLVSGCMVSWAGVKGRSTGRAAAPGFLLLLGSVTLVIIAADAFFFLFAWESLTIAFFVLAGARRTERPATRAAWVTLGVGKVSGASLLIGFLLLAGRTGSYALAAWSHVPAGAVHDAAYLLVVIGFVAKVGVVPFQVWLPLGYPAAPGPARAAMAGLAANVGFYGLWRFLGVLGRPPEWLAIATLVAGATTALLGIVFAGVQARLDRVLAYSSVENAGLITVGYGVALVGAATGHPPLVAIGLLAASLQVLAHAVAKTSLFASSPFFLDDWGTDRLDELRGVGHTHRFASVAFGLSSLTLAGAPPTIGFVSEWFLLESLMQEFRVGPLALRLAMGYAGALVALTVGIAALTFIRLLGLTILSRPADRSRSPREVHDGGILGRAGFVVLAVSCVGLAAVAPSVIRYLASGLTPIVARSDLLSALKSPWVLQPVYHGFSILSPSWLTVVMPIGFVVVALMAVAASQGRALRVRRVPAWRSAASGVPGTDRYTSFGYANVLRHVLGNVLGARRQMITVHDETDAGITEAARVEARTSVVEPVEAYVYGPGRRLFLRVSRAAKRLQSGRLDAYIGYMLFAIVVVLIVVAAL